MKITFTIPANKIGRIVTAMKGLYPIPHIPDPDNEGQMIPQFTGGQWAKESVRRWIRNQVARYEQKMAKDAISFLPEDDIVT